jgi:hypothetical protein
VIRFPVLNGAMSVARSRALAGAIRDARDAKVILLTGGPEFWCNGIDLATIEAADSPAEESLAAIEAIDDVCLALLETTGSWTMAAMAGNAGAGGVFMALAADRGRGAGGHGAQPALQEHGQPLWLGILDLHPAPPPRARGRGAADGNPHADPRAGGGEDRAGGRRPRRHAGDVRGRDDRRAEALAGSAEFDAMLEAKRAARAADEAEKAARRLPGGGACAHAAELLRLRHELPRGAAELHHRRPEIPHAAASGAAPAKRGRIAAEYRLLHVLRAACVGISSRAGSARPSAQWASDTIRRSTRRSATIRTPPPSRLPDHARSGPTRATVVAAMPSIMQAQT